MSELNTRPNTADLRGLTYVILLPLLFNIVLYVVGFVVWPELSGFAAQAHLAREALGPRLQLMQILAFSIPVVGVGYLFFLARARRLGWEKLPALGALLVGGNWLLFGVLDAALLASLPELRPDYAVGHAAYTLALVFLSFSGTSAVLRFGTVRLVRLYHQLPLPSSEPEVVVTRRPAGRSATALEAALPDRTARVLIVEDDPALISLLQTMLAAKEFRPVAVSSVAEATHALRTFRYDLVLTDLALPDGDGIQVLLTLRESDPTCPAVVLTAYAGDHERRMALEAGAVAFLHKPVDLDVLAEELRRQVRVPGSAIGVRRGK